MKYDREKILELGRGRWSSVIRALTNCDEETLSGKSQACPRCGGTDRFRFTDVKGSGSFFCNRCGKSNNGIETVRWFLNCEFSEAIEKVGQFVGVEPTEGTKKEKFDPSKLLELLDTTEEAKLLGFNSWSIVKSPITSSALITVGARLGRLKWYDQSFPVIAMPVWGPQLGEASPVGWVMYHVAGAKLPSGKKDSPEWSKMRMSYKCGRGFICDPDRFKNATHLIKTEGPTDALAILSMDGLPGKVAPFTTVNGSLETPIEWMVQAVEGKHVIVCHDNDEPGIQGAEKWSVALASKAETLGNASLQFPEGSKGKDLRDWINEGGNWDEFKNLPIKSYECGKELELEDDELPNEEHDDPHRLAKQNIDRYQSSHGGRLVYWKSEWWRYKAGRYQRISDCEFRAKVTASIRKEFVEVWKEEVRKYKKWTLSQDYSPEKDKGKPKVKKVTRALVNNVIGATESLCVIPSSITMPRWLPTREKRNYLSMMNGIFDLESLFSGAEESKCIFPHTPDWFSACRLSYDFNPEATCPRWLKYLDYVMEGDQSRINVLQEWAGYLLTTENDLQRFLVLEGEGKNGKTVYFAAITAMLSEDNVGNVSIEKFGDKFALASTMGKMVNISGDAGHIDSVAEGVLKMFTGGDVMEFDRKNREPEKFRPTAKFMCAWNTRPVIKDKSQGVWRRMILLPFQREVEKHMRVAGMDHHEWWIKSGETSGILNWALAGLHRLREQGDFTETDVSRRAVEEYRVDSNPAFEFLCDHLIEGEEHSMIECKDLYQWYTSWCRSTGHKPCSDRNFGKDVKRKFPKTSRRRVRDGSSLTWKYIGIKFSTDEILGEKINF